MQLFNWARLVAPFAIDIGRVAWRHAVRQQRLPLWSTVQLPARP
jgi:hypothetical protein